jgi:hypothetical protein
METRQLGLFFDSLLYIHLKQLFHNNPVMKITDVQSGHILCEVFLAYC